MDKRHVIAQKGDDSKPTPGRVEVPFAEAVLELSQAPKLRATVLLLDRHFPGRIRFYRRPQGNLETDMDEQTHELLSELLIQEETD